jgi:hypothetical protein
MDDIARIDLAFQLLERVVGPAFLASVDWELVVINEHARLEAMRRAAAKLAQVGASAAARTEGCCRATVYNRAHAARKKSNEMAVG